MICVCPDRETAEKEGYVELISIPTSHSSNEYGGPVLILGELLPQLFGKYSAIMGEVVACVVLFIPGHWFWRGSSDQIDGLVVPGYHEATTILYYRPSTLKQAV